jgi:ribosomal protein S18 acetylase RimI-like enzyme
MNEVPAIRRSTPNDRDWIKNVLEGNWGGATIVVRDEAFDCLNLPALIAGDRRGLLIYRVGELAEIIILESSQAGAGMGAALINALVNLVRAAHVPGIRVTTTNDNVDALRFYQQRGFRLVELRVGAVDRARRRKPSIPERGMYSIAMHDELELELRI